MKNETFFKKFRGDKQPRPPRIPTRIIALAGVGAFGTMCLFAWLGSGFHQPLLLASFGGTCLLVFAFPDSPFSQPRHIVGGHVLGTLLGLICLSLFDVSWWSMALAVAATVALSLRAGVVHPPASANAIIVMTSHTGWKFLLTPTLAGSVLIVVMALVFHNATRKLRYPKYW